MRFTKDGITVETSFADIIKTLAESGWDIIEEDVSLADRVEALEDAVVDIATEVYGNG